jgi:hypothetical protein
MANAVENGERLPRIDTLMKLAAALEVQLDALVEGIEWLPPGSPLRGASRSGGWHESARGHDHEAPGDHGDAACRHRPNREGRNAVQVQRWLGHHSPSFTLDTYVHMLDPDLGDPLASLF